MRWRGCWLSCRCCVEETPLKRPLAMITPITRLIFVFMISRGRAEGVWVVAVAPSKPCRLHREHILTDRVAPVATLSAEVEERKISQMTLRSRVEMRQFHCGPLQKRSSSQAAAKHTRMRTTSQPCATRESHRPQPAHRHSRIPMDAPEHESIRWSSWSM